ncbi:MAG: hypothetical protein A2X46_06920 [Lentisphaerae bacterium GWF2_57_35]|nr:MAG: hypothetical protein A2X46_06920 [Lentisphaerae bacterium GWF2_57_35]
MALYWLLPLDKWYSIEEKLLCLFFGWWGFPWGLIMTPIQLGRNVFGLFTSPDPTRPSAALTSIVRANLAAAYVAEHQARKQTSEQ